MKRPKPLGELTPADLLSEPVWVWAIDAEGDGDETMVRPFRCSEVPAAGDFHVACDVVTCAGKALTGLILVRDGAVDAEVPTVTTGEQHWDVEAVPPQRDREAFRLCFGAPYDEIFPLSWALRQRIVGEAQHFRGTYNSSVRLGQVSAVCPHCGGVLRTDRAWQCPHCFRSWA